VALDKMLISKTHLKEDNRFGVPNYFFYKCEASYLERNIIHQALYFFDLVSLEAVGVIIGEVDIIAVYKLPNRVMHKSDLIRFLLTLPVSY
jgi:hypothetical protein